VIQLKKLAMQQHGLANSDLLAHVAITEAGYMRKRARVVHGPWSYSLYTITLFLLTDEGVRVIASDLDFEKGQVTDERRTDFSYSAISAAKAAQMTLYYDGARRIVVGENDVVPPQAARPVRSNGFQMSISTGPPISLVLERFTDDYFNRTVEDLNQLKDDALDCSGVAAAMRILEPVAAEGRQWLTQERQRRARRLMSRAPFMPFPFSQPLRLIASSPATEPADGRLSGWRRLIPGELTEGSDPDSAGQEVTWLDTDTSGDAAEPPGDPADPAADESDDGSPDEAGGSGTGWPGAAEPSAADPEPADPEAAERPYGVWPSVVRPDVTDESPADPAEPDGQQPDGAAGSQNPLQLLMKLSRLRRKPKGKTREDKPAEDPPPSQ
jgi:hypothetical protein